MSQLDVQIADATITPVAKATKYRVLVNEKIADAGIAALAERFDVTVTPGWSADQLAEEIGAFDAIVVRSATKLTAELIARGTKLQVIGRAGVGVDNVDLDAASMRGIVVVNAPTSTVQSVAEHALALILASARNIHIGDATMRAGTWDRSRLGGIELGGKRLALLGVGRIGFAVSERARALGMTVTGYDPFVSRERFQRMGIEHAATLEEAVADADFVSLHMPFTPDTEGLIGEAELRMMPRRARIINTARGGLLNLDALHAAISEGRIAGAGIDVYPSEPPEGHPLFALEQVVLTPHLAASTREAQDRAGVAVAEQVLAALTGGSVTAAVNVLAIDPADVEALQPFAPVAGRLARLADALAGAPATSLRVEALGEIASWDVRMLTWNALIAMLSPTTEEPVTFVNARQIAERRGISVDESVDEVAPDYREIVRVTVAGESEATVCGTTIGADDRPWLVSALGFDVDIELAGHVALFRYDDVPGVIGRVGTVFGDAGVNIANMAVARREGQALMVISFDQEPAADAVAQLRDLPGVDLAVAVSL